jgi:hypothetical protein
MSIRGLQIVQNSPLSTSHLDRYMAATTLNDVPVNFRAFSALLMDGSSELSEDVL